jgi:hypothetical protein
MVVDTAQSENNSLDSPTDIVVDAAHISGGIQGNIFTLSCMTNNISGGIQGNLSL